MGGMEIGTLFKKYSQGVQTNRDNWVYDFDCNSLKQRLMRFIDIYNGEVASFVLYDDTKIQWSRDLKSDLKRKRYAQYQSFSLH